MVDNEHEMGQRWAVGNQMYEIEPGGQPLVALWFGCDPVRVLPSRSKHWPARLRNERTGESVKARNVRLTA